MKVNVILSLLFVSMLLFSCSNSGKKGVYVKNKQVTDNVTEINKIVGLATIEPLTLIVSLFSDVGGIVEKINYDISSEVRADEVIFKLNDDVEKAQLEQTKSKLATQQTMINAAIAQLASLKAKMASSQLTYSRNVSLVKAGAVTQQITDDSKFTYESAQNDVLSAEASVKEQEAKKLEIEADINYYRTLIARKSIKAPATGKVLSVDIKIGSYVMPSQSLGNFAPDGPLMAITEVDELYAERVKEGMKAYIRTEGQTDTLAAGKVYLTSPYLRKKTLFSDDATNMEDMRVREVRVLLDKSDKILIGSRVECVILLKP